MIYEYECQVCGHLHEIWHKMEEKNKKPCDKCKAPPRKLKKVLATPIKPHGSWGRWQV